jgi:hypothetical protein
MVVRREEGAGERENLEASGGKKRSRSSSREKAK